MLNCIGRVVYAFRRNFSNNYRKKAATKYIGPEMIPIRCNPSSEMICTSILTAKSQLNNIKAGLMYNEYFKDDSWNTYAAYALIKENIQFVSSKSTGRLYSGTVLTAFQIFLEQWSSLPCLLRSVRRILIMQFKVIIKPDWNKHDVSGKEFK